VDGHEGFLDVRGIEADQRVLSDFGAVNRLNLDFINGALAAFRSSSLSGGYDRAS
jgi:hypothetical protein